MTGAVTVDLENTDQNADPWLGVAELQATLTLELAIPGFTVSQLMKIARGSVLSTGWPTNRDIPLSVNGQLLGWAEFESSGKTMDARITEFAWEHSQKS